MSDQGSPNPLVLGTIAVGVLLRVGYWALWYFDEDRQHWNSIDKRPISEAHQLDLSVETHLQRFPACKHRRELEAITWNYCDNNKYWCGVYAKYLPNGAHINEASQRSREYADEEAAKTKAREEYVREIENGPKIPTDIIVDPIAKANDLSVWVEGNPISRADDGRFAIPSVVQQVDICYDEFISLRKIRTCAEEGVTSGTPVRIPLTVLDVNSPNAFGECTLKQDHPPRRSHYEDLFGKFNQPKDFPVGGTTRIIGARGSLYLSCKLNMTGPVADPVQERATIVSRLGATQRCPKATTPFPPRVSAWSAQ